MRKNTAGFVAEGKHDNNAREVCPNIKAMKRHRSWGKVGRTAAVSLLFLISACTKEASAPAPTVHASQEVKPTPTVTVAPTLTAEEIREQRLNEIAGAVEENDYRFSVEELSDYLLENGTGWEGGVEVFISTYEGAHVPFKYFFIENNKGDSGLYLSPVPYQHSSERTMSDKNNFATPKIISEVVLGKITRAIYYDLDLNTTSEKLGWINEPGKYTTIIYITTQYDANGQPYDAFFTDSEDLFFEDAESNVESVSWEDAVNKNLTDEEIELFTDDVLESLRAKEGWTMFMFDEDGILQEKMFNAKDFVDLLHSLPSSDATAQETK